MNEPVNSANAPEPGGLRLIFRAVRAADKPRVLEFTANTWTEGDYIQDVFDEWLADPTGRFTAIELDAHAAALRGRPVAIGKLTDLGEGELWIEGLRVDPAHRRKGIGEALHNYHVDLAKRVGGRVLRYATNFDNVASRLFAERTGFEHVSSYRMHVAGASIDFSLPEKLTLDDWLTLRAWLDSPLMRSAHGLYPRAWRWSTLSEARVKAHLEAGQVFGLRNESGLHAWSICALEEGWSEASLHHLDGSDPASLVEMAQAMRRYASEAGRKTVETFALEPSPSVAALRASGYRVEDFTLIIFELQLK